MQSQQYALTVKQLKATAYDLHQQLQHTKLRKISGSDTFERNVSKELQKLQNIGDDSQVYSSTSILYLSAIWQHCLNVGLNNVQAIRKKKKYEDQLSGDKCMVIIDIVCNHGLTWVKIKSKNPYSMQAEIIKTESRSNIVVIADHYIQAAKAHKVKFKTPKIEIVFSRGVTSDVLFLLKQKGVVCIGTVIKDNILFVEQDDEEEEEEEDSKQQQEHKEKQENKSQEEEIQETSVNLGPKTMMTMISALGNGEVLHEFWQVVENYVLHMEDHPDQCRSSIYFQALTFTYNSKMSHKLFSSKSHQMLSNMVGNYYEELQYPALPVIEQYIGKCKMYCCQSAWDSVTKLVGMGAGPNELRRYQDLQRTVTVVPDVLSDRTIALQGKGMSKVNKAVFGTGDALQMLTVAGAPVFVRKARHKGVDFYCKLHDVRPFVEQYQVGYKVFCINQGFDVDALKVQLAEDEVDLNFEEEEEEEDDDEEDANGFHNPDLSDQDEM